VSPGSLGENEDPPKAERVSGARGESSEDSERN
jgi:hypothetical protein